MKTLTKQAIMPKTGGNVILLEDYEFGMPEWQLDEIHNDWENGSEIEQIVFKQKRPGMEIVFALLDLADRGKLKRPVAKLMRG